MALVDISSARLSGKAGRTYTGMEQGNVLLNMRDREKGKGGKGTDKTPKPEVRGCLLVYVWAPICSVLSSHNDSPVKFSVYGFVKNLLFSLITVISLAVVKCWRLGRWVDFRAWMSSTFSKGDLHLTLPGNLLASRVTRSHWAVMSEGTLKNIWCNAAGALTDPIYYCCCRAAW